MIPMRDLLRCGNEARLNQPSTFGMNWKWRMEKGDFREDIIGRLRWLTDTFQRTLQVPEENVEAETGENLESEESSDLPEGL